MTRKKAIEQLKINRPYAYTELREAVDMAIEALQTEPCEDCISRQAVLDYIDKMPSELNQYGNRMIRRIRLTEYIADSLSSVQPEQKGDLNGDE